MTSAPDLVVIGLRALAFVAVFQAAGAAVFLNYHGSGLPGTAPAVGRLTAVAAAAGMALVLAQHALEPARMVASFAGIWDVTLHSILLESDAGTARAVRLAGLAVVLIGVSIKREVKGPTALVGAVITLLSFVLMGHTAAHAGRWMLAVLLLAHLLVAAYWFGALATFWLAADRDGIAENARAIERFSAAAVWLVPSILIAGLCMAAWLVPDWSAVTGSPYGRLLLIKLALFSGLLALAAWNRFRLVPAIGGHDADALQRFRRIVAVEWWVVASVLVVTAVMTGLFGP